MVQEKLPAPILSRVTRPQNKAGRGATQLRNEAYFDVRRNDETRSDKEMRSSEVS